MKYSSTLLGIALKDSLRAFRSAAAVVFMFGVPILVTLMFSFMFGGGDEGPSFSLPVTQVIVANLDLGSPAFSQNLAALNTETNTAQNFDFAGIESLGEILLRSLQAEALADLVEVTTASDAQSAYQAVNNGEAGVALVIPPDFTTALIDADTTAQVELYHDPTLTVGPQIVHSIVSGFIDSTLQTPIGMQVIYTELYKLGLNPGPEMTEKMVARLLSANIEGQTFNIQAPVQDEKAVPNPQANPIKNIVNLVMGGMMIFYAFFTGATMAQTILIEEESGTLARAFTTPVPAWAILGGKFLASVVTVLVQVTLLLIFGSLVFKIHWGDTVSVVLAAVGIIILASTFGIFLVSLMKNSRQAGIVFGGGLTLTGMIGIFSVFTFGAPAAAKITETMALVVPQGWAMTALRKSVEGASGVEVLPFLLGMLVWSVILGVIGVLRFNKRFV
jgi:ABC-2 type transport system permease protein